MRHIRDFVAGAKSKRNRHRNSASEIKRDFSLSGKHVRGDARTLKKKRADLFRSNAKRAETIWGALPKATLHSLRELTDRNELSIAAGDLQLLEGKWYVTHCGLVRIATRLRCSAIITMIDRVASDPANSRWVFRATVYKSPRSRGFVGYGDADPSNVSSLVHGAEMRVAETRAVNRALRKAYGIGLCSVEELGSLSSRPELPTSKQDRSGSPPMNGSGNGHPRLRDRLCLLIRKHRLDAAQVKLYAAEFCSTPVLRQASRDQVEAFIAHLADWADRDRDGLLCKLNSYSPTPEVNP